MSGILEKFEIKNFVFINNLNKCVWVYQYLPLKI